MTIAAAVAVALLLPQAAGAAPVVTLPGHSEADQYYETVPGPTAPRSRDPDRNVDDAVEEGVLDEEAAETLEQSGEEGGELARAVAQTAPPDRSPPGGGGSGEEPDGAGVGSGDEPNGAAGGENRGSAGGGEAAGGEQPAGAPPAQSTVSLERQGLGPWLPVLLGVMTVLMAAYALAQWRRRSGSGPNHDAA